MECVFKTKTKEKKEQQGGIAPPESVFARHPHLEKGGEGKKEGFLFEGGGNVI